jgi:acyl carrier protein
MTRSEFLTMLDDILEQPAGTLHGNEELSSLENWDSLAIVSVIAQVHVETGYTLEAKAVKACTNVSELLALCEPLALVG